MMKIEKNVPSQNSVIKVKWIDGLRFVAVDDLGHSILVDASKQDGGEGSGFSPIQLLLIALGGCTGMDIVHIMQKQRQEISGLEVLVSGSRVDNPPRVYDSINVEYRISGKHINDKAAKRAIQLSEEKYCSVGASLRVKKELTTSYTIEQE